MNNNTTTITYTRQQRLNNECTHEQYYNQFVTDNLLDIVKNRFGLAALKKAYTKDKHFNSIALAVWDSLAPYCHVGAKLRELGDVPTLAGYVCILKAAARQLATQ